MQDQEFKSYLKLRGQNKVQQRMMEGRFDKEKEVFVVIKTTCKWPARPRKSDSLKDTSYQASPPTPSAA